MLYRLIFAELSTTPHFGPDKLYAIETISRKKLCKQILIKVHNKDIINPE